jgi:hypothetical protein
VGGFNSRPVHQKKGGFPAMNATPEKVLFRSNLWKKFVAEYHVILVTKPEEFSAYCEEFRKRWIAGE